MRERFSTRSDTNRAVQPQKIVKGLKRWIQKDDELHYIYILLKYFKDHPSDLSICCIFCQFCGANKTRYRKTVFYAPNFEEVEEAYWFGPVHLPVTLALTQEPLEIGI